MTCAARSPLAYSGSACGANHGGSLNHISGSRGGIAGVYQRHDWAFEKRAALDAWATRVCSIVEGSIEDANVVKMPRTA